MVLDYVAKLKKNIPLREGITVDDGWDQLNRGGMFMTLCIFGVVVTVRQYTGSIISCDGFTKFSTKFVEDYCWTQGIYTVKEAYDKPMRNVPYPGVIPENVPPCMELELTHGGRVVCPHPDDVKKPTRVYHLWYQWIPFYFWLAALAFHMPYMLYKTMGMGEIKGVVTLLHNPVTTEEEIEKNVSKAVTWLYYKLSIFLRPPCCLLNHMGRHRLGAAILITKTMYLLVAGSFFALTGQMFQIGDFKYYGSQWSLSLLGPDNITTSIRNRIFPKMVACEIMRWGTSGIEDEHGTCVLAPNVVNQYLFLILWFLLVFLIATNTLSLLVAIAKLCYVYGGYRRLLLQAYMQNDESVKTLYFMIGSSGRVLLHVMAANTRPKVFEDVIKTLTQKLKLSIANGDCEHGVNGTS